MASCGGTKWKIIHRDATRSLRWWELGEYAPAVLIGGFHTFDRAGSPIEIAVRYYGTEMVNPRDFTSAVGGDFTELKRYCALLANATRKYALSREPIYDHYLPKGLFGPGSELARIMCVDPPESLIDQLPDL